MKVIFATLTAASLLFGAGCATQRPLGADFGNATQHNKAVQIANPETSTVAPTYDGTHTVNAVKRYREGLVEEPTAEETAKQ